ncbi:formin-binding protein 1 homolog [Austrofundulus limnaeus]|uniref:Formin-binding protein 1 homolog n=1 Tax=Austrofundulus limnaeus TaxID=52670 RepID=A0A2I4AJV7_AUSLI|nr:PREDICTED: formin-binding protein 1 homolog [Austrofundulus limnaeus]
MDADINVTKADVEKARQQAQMRHQMASDSKGDYSSYLQKFNQEQNEHYYTVIPNIFQKLQDMEEKRIERVGVCMKTFADVDRQVLPIVGKCLDGMTTAAEAIEPKTVSLHTQVCKHTYTHMPYGMHYSLKQAVSCSPHRVSEGACQRNWGRSRMGVWTGWGVEIKATHP